MSKFKKGDMVVCVDTGGFPSLSKGKEYVVLDGCQQYARIVNDCGKGGGYANYRFELVDERQALSDAIALVQKYEIGVNVTTNKVWSKAVMGHTNNRTTEQLLDKLFPPTPTAQELEVARIETEMRALADSLAKAKEL